MLMFLCWMLAKKCGFGRHSILGADVYLLAIEEFADLRAQ